MVGRRGNGTGRRGWRAALRILLWGLMGALVLLLASFLLPFGRNAWLGSRLDTALKAVPGELRGDWTWPRLDLLEGRHVLWTAPGASGADVDTLAIVERVSIRFNLRALRSRQLVIHGLDLDASRLDVPRIRAHFPKASAGDDSLRTAKAIPYLLEGSVPSFPSAEIKDLRVAVGSLVLPGGIAATNLRISASASILDHATPQLVVNSGSAFVASRAATSWQLELASLQAGATYDPRARAVTLDSLIATVPSVALSADTLRIHAGPADVRASGAWADSSGNLAADVRFQAEIPVALQDRIAAIEMPEIAGRLGLQAHGTATTLRLDATLDLDPSPDVRRGHGRGFLLADLQPGPRLREVRVDSLNVQWRQAVIEAAGSWAVDTVDGRFAIDLGDLELAAVLAPALMDGVTGRARLVGIVAGAPRDPRVSGSIVANGDIASVWKLPGMAEAAKRLPPDFPREEFRHITPDLQADFDGTMSALRVDLRLDLGRTPWLDRGLVVGNAVVAPRSRGLGPVHLDTLSVALRGAEIMVTGDLDTLRADLDAVMTMNGTALVDLFAPQALPAADLDVQAEARVAGPWRDLGGEARLTGRIITAEFAAPIVEATVVGSRSAMRATARATGGVRMGSVVLDSVSAIWDGRMPADKGIPAGTYSLALWAPDAAGSLHGVTTGEAHRTTTIDSLVIEAAGQVTRSTAPIIVELGPGPGELSVSGLRLRGGLGTLDLDGRMVNEELSLKAAVDLVLTREWLDAVFPTQFWSKGDGLDVAIEGDVDLSNDAIGEQDANRQPALRGQSTLRLIPRNNDPEAVLALDFHLAHGDTTGLVGALDFGMDGTDLARGSLFWPGAIDRTNGRWLAAGEARGGADIPEQALPLDFINRFLPPEYSLDGNVMASAAATMAAPVAGTPDTLLNLGTLSGSAHTGALRVNLPNRSRMDMTGKLGVEGRLLDPRVTGTVTITDGLFRLPESERVLLPTTGTAALWIATGQAGVDSVVASTSAPGIYVPDMDVHVIIPGNFKVIGNGLELDLAGDLRVGRGTDDYGRHAPVLRGDLLITEGRLNAMNRLFEVERGELTFEGRIPVNPTLDLVLVADIDGTVVRILVTGTAMSPKIELRSEPEMIQADIMAFLVFGRPFNELDTEQAGGLGGERTPAQQLQQNLQGLAMVFGAAGVQDRVAGSIGVDQVQIGSDTAGGSTLVLGKFINPRLLLKYHQSLARSSAYFMTLEYTISRLFKLISTYGQGEEASGVELRWQERY
ncbi:MAG: translocation/assembly module TamB [bacterium]|nr:translocation/assembly module TamB [bacterium]